MSEIKENEVKIQESKKVWVAWTNTDCNEGRGIEVPYAVCAIKETALRRGKKGSVQGSNCRVSEETVVRVNNLWLVPGRIIMATKEDEAAQKKMDARNEALNRAKKAGLADEDLLLLSQ